MTFDMNAHNALVEEMEAEHARTGLWRDPISGKLVPTGKVIKRNPNRAERRALAAWRSS